MDGNPNAQGNPIPRHVSLEDGAGIENREERDQSSIDERAFRLEFAQGSQTHNSSARINRDEVPYRFTQVLPGSQGVSTSRCSTR